MRNGTNPETQDSQRTTTNQRRDHDEHGADMRITDRKITQHL